MASSSAVPAANPVRVRSWGLPLLAKDLTEVAARKRTYQVRVGYAVAVLLVGLFVLGASVQTGPFSSVTALGAGKPVFETLTFLQFIGLYAALPILACSSLTVEKERNTLQLLLITKLGPWTIIFEKFLSVVVLASNYLLLGLPVLAFSYAFGGIEQDELLFASGGLVLLSIRLSAIGVMCSAVFSTSGRALVATYLIDLCLRVVDVVGVQLLLHWISQWLYPNSTGGAPTDFTTLWGLATFFEVDPLIRETGIELAVNGVFEVSIAAACLTLGRWNLVPPLWLRRNWISRGLQSRRETAAAILEERSPDFDDPISWSESPRGNARRWWLKKCLLAALPILMFLVAVRLVLDADAARVGGAIVSLVVWLAVTVRICSQASCLIAEERVRQTLDVLRCTPLTPKNIVRQKLQQVWRTVYLSRVVLIACVVGRSVPDVNFTFVIASAVMIWLYPVVTAWLALSCGLAARNGAAAILKTMLTLVAWCFLPLVCCIPFVTGLSPLPLLYISEIGMFTSTVSLGEFDLYVIIMGACTFVCQFIRISQLRKWVLEQADSKIRTVPVYPEKHPPIRDNNYDRVLRFKSGRSAEPPDSDVWETK